jgi:hypothetical protein
VPAFPIATVSAPGTVILARILAVAILALGAAAAAAQTPDDASASAFYGTITCIESPIVLCGDAAVMEKVLEEREARRARFLEHDRKALARYRANVGLIVTGGLAVAVVGCAAPAIFLQPEILLVTCLVPLMFIVEGAGIYQTKVGNMEEFIQTQGGDPGAGTFLEEWELLGLSLFVFPGLFVYLIPGGRQGLLEFWLASRARHLDELRFKRGAIVSFDDAGISAQLPRAEAETLAWAAVRRIAIERVGSSPAGAGLWWVLEGEGRRCAFPRGARGERDVLETLAARFPGFDREAVVEAERSRTEARFACWERGTASRGDGAVRRRAATLAHQADATH